MVLTRMFTCVAERPTTDAAMSRPMRRTPGSASRARVSPSMGRHPVARSDGSWASSWSSPPSRVPSAQPLHRPLRRPARPPEPEADGDRADVEEGRAPAPGAVKRPWALSIPMATAESETSRRNGIIKPGEVRPPPRRTRPSRARMTATSCSAQVDRRPARSPPPPPAPATPPSRPGASACVGAAVAPRVGEGRDEGAGERPLGEEVAQQVGDAERHHEGVGPAVGPDEDGEELVAQEPEHPRGHGGRRQPDGAPDLHPTSCPCSPGPPAPSSS